MIPIQAKDNQSLNDNIIALSWWLYGTNIKKYLKIYKKYDHGIINWHKYIILAQRVITVHNVSH
jgi:hypothetical protein